MHIEGKYTLVEDEHMHSLLAQLSEKRNWNNMTSFLEPSLSSGVHRRKAVKDITSEL